MFRNKAKKNIRNLDKIVTWVIIGSAVASIFWIKKISSSRKNKLATEKTDLTEVRDKIALLEEKTSSKKQKTTILSLIWKILVLPLKPFKKKKK